jgi:hypothetical protein
MNDTTENLRELSASSLLGENDGGPGWAELGERYRVAVRDAATRAWSEPASPSQSDPASISEAQGHQEIPREMPAPQQPRLNA